jgi:hypothetical protein
LTAGRAAANNERMSLEIFRLHLASVQGVDGRRWPVHGFVVTRPGGAVRAQLMEAACISSGVPGYTRRLTAVTPTTGSST